MACSVPKQSWVTPRASGHRQWLALSGLVTTGHVVSRRLDATWWSSGGKAVRRRVNTGNINELKLSRWRNVSTLTVWSHPSEAISWLWVLWNTHAGDVLGIPIWRQRLWNVPSTEVKTGEFFSPAVKTFTGHSSPGPEFPADSVWLSEWPKAFATQVCFTHYHQHLFLACKMCLTSVFNILFLQLNAFQYEWQCCSCAITPFFASVRNYNFQLQFPLVDVSVL